MLNIKTKIFEWLNIDRQFEILETMLFCIVILSSFLVTSNSTYVTCAYCISLFSLIIIYLLNKNHIKYSLNGVVLLSLTFLFLVGLLSGHISYVLFIFTTVTPMENIVKVSILASCISLMFITWLVVTITILLSQYSNIVGLKKSDA